mmetsp:Transcript_8428/g.12849  ORF Transcript_8428/g.12849 Transcript_8428/m.12849 type:complete len:102 (+) Transcript_8428:2258-2563(+)
MGRYFGEWQEGKYHGLGAYLGVEGSSYDGGWKSGLMSGHGKFTWPLSKGSAIFLGEFKEDKRVSGKIFDATCSFLTTFRAANAAAHDEQGAAAGTGQELVN